MQNTATTLNEVVSIYNDGATFYEQGAEKVDNQMLSGLFKQMADLRKEAAQDLTPFVDGRGEDVTESGTLAGQIRQGYTKLLSMLSENEKAYIAQLEEQEDATLEALRYALDEETLTPNVRNVLQEQYSLFKLTHDKMRDMKKMMH